MISDIFHTFLVGALAGAGLIAFVAAFVISLEIMISSWKTDVEEDE